MRLQYFDSSYGQIHLRYLQARGEKTSPPLVCLHPIPSSGLYLTSIMPLLNQERDVIAPDYPGYGGSQPLTNKPAIKDFAQAVIEALGNSSFAGPFDLFGFHTGSLVGPEISLIQGDMVRRLILVDVPYFEKALREELYDEVTSSDKITNEMESLSSAWEFNIDSRIGDVPLERAFELFVEHLRTGNNSTLGFHAAFTYPCEEQFPKIQHPVLVIATQSGLLQPSREAARKLQNCSLVECLNIQSAVMETGIEEIAQTTCSYLSTT